MNFFSSENSQHPHTCDSISKSFPSFPMQKITPHIWFDTQAIEAAEFYCTVFPKSKIAHKSQLENTPSGTVDMVNLKIWNSSFAFISAGPYFKINPSVSFTVICETEKEVDSIWSQLEKDGQALMPLDEYPFSKKYGWVMDQYGVSWQIILIAEKAPAQRIVPAMMFTQDLCGKAEEALHFYTSVFHDSKIGEITRYTDEVPDTEGKTQHASFQLEGQQFTLLDSPYNHEFTFNEAISFMVSCETQEEIDYYWDKLSAVPEAEQCGWLKDKYGFSWQIVPRMMGSLMESADKEKKARVTEAFLKMKKFNIDELEEAAK